MITHTSSTTLSKYTPTNLLAEQIFLKKALGVTKTQISKLVRLPLTKENVRLTADLIGKADRIRDRLKEIQALLQDAELRTPAYQN